MFEPAGDYATLEFQPLPRRHPTDILEHGLRMPILVRRDEARFVLVEGLHRLEACKALGERTIKALVVQARRS
jgi:hypothetical protein